MATSHSDYETISTISALIQKVDTDLQSKFSVSFEQFHILDFIKNIYPKQTTVSALAKQFHSNNSATSRKVSVLYKENLIQDHVSGEDRRTHWITLAQKGNAIIHDIKIVVDSGLPDLETKILVLLSNTIKNDNK